MAGRFAAEARNAAPDTMVVPPIVMREIILGTLEKWLRHAARGALEAKSVSSPEMSAGAAHGRGEKRRRTRRAASRGLRERVVSMSDSHRRQKRCLARRTTRWNWLRADRKASSASADGDRRRVRKAAFRRSKASRHSSDHQSGWGG